MIPNIFEKIKKSYFKLIEFKSCFAILYAKIKDNING